VRDKNQLNSLNRFYSVPASDYWKELLLAYRAVHGSTLMRRDKTEIDTHL